MVDVIGGVEIGVDEMAEEVEDAELTDAFALLRVVPDVSKSSGVIVGEYNKCSVCAASLQPMFV